MNNSTKIPPAFRSDFYTSNKRQKVQILKTGLSTITTKLLQASNPLWNCLADVSNNFFFSFIYCQTKLSSIPGESTNINQFNIKYEPRIWRNFSTRTLTSITHCWWNSKSSLVPNTHTIDTNIPPFYNLSYT